MPESKIKHVAATLIKSADLPEDILKADEVAVDQWFYATVEVEDREGDIIRVGGVDTKSFTESGAIKFISGHSEKPMADGRLPVVGKIAKFVKTKHKSTGAPALVVGVEFAPSALGQETKKLYETGFLTDVSVGLRPIEATPIRGKGIDYTRTEMVHLAACVNGMNQLASVVRALDAETPPTPPAPLKLSDEDIDKIRSANAALITELFKSLNSRMDDFEDSLSALPNGDGQKADRQDHQSSKIDLDKLRTLLATL